MVTNEIADRAMALIAESGGNYEYFFSQLNSPDWITPLKERGRFSHPPGAVSDETSIRFPFWPEGEYLKRMALLAPELVFDAIDTKCYTSSNHTVHQTLLEIGAQLPAALAAQVAIKETKWVSQQNRLHGPYDERSIAFLLSLATGGQAEAALSLIDKIIDVRAPDLAENEAERLTQGYPYRFGVDPLGRIDIWDISRLMHAVTSQFVKVAPSEYLSVLARKLNKALVIYDNERGNTEDYSTIWRPRIDSEHLPDYRGVFVSAAKDAAVLIAQQNEEGLRTVREILSAQKWPIFRRIEFHALTQIDSLPADFVSSLLVDPANYQSTTGNPEFNEFLQKWVAKAPQDARKAILEIVDSGPDFSRYSRYLDEQEAQGKRGDAEQWLRELWRRGWLTPLKDILDSEQIQELEQLTAKYGPPEPDLSTGGFRGVGHVSEIDLAEMRRMSIDDLLRYLKGWTPPPMEHPETPSRAGLASHLSAWASDEPAFFASNLAVFQDLALHPTYLRTLLDSFTAALKGQEEFDVYAVAKTIEWLLANTKSDPSEKWNWNEDPGWSWGHMSSARFLTELFLHSDRLDAERRAEFWPALQRVSQIPFQEPDDLGGHQRKADLRPRKTDYGVLALNTARSVGLEAVMRYARWLKLLDNGLEVSAKTMPHVFDLLASHLDPSVDASVAVREMYGMQFTLLAWLDREWFAAQLPSLFPAKPHKTLDKFAWQSYLRFSRPIVELLPAMRFRYDRAINALDRADDRVDEGARALGSHLLRFLAAGAIELDDPLVTTFFLKASPALRAQTVGDVGWHLGREEPGPLDAKTQSRLMAFWEERRAVCVKEGNAAKKEMGAFGWWLASKKFPDEWSIKQAVKVATTFRDLHPDFAVVERLRDLAVAFPYEAVRCLGILLEEDRDGWGPQGWSENAEIILTASMNASAESRSEATRVINLFVARGHRSYRRLLDLPEL